MEMPLSEVAEWLHRCARCGNCKTVYGIFKPSCPSGEEFKLEAFYPSGRIWIARGIYTGKVRPSRQLIKSIYTCTTCASCTVQCVLDLHEHIVDIIEALREELVRMGVGPTDPQARLAKYIKMERNPYLEPHSKRMELLRRLNVYEKRKADIVYFVGCTAAYIRKEVAEATVRILKECGVEFSTLKEDEWCCGSPLLRIGQVDLAKEIADHNAAAIEESGAIRVLTSCAGCYKTLKKDYPKMGRTVSAEVIHVTDLLAELIAEDRLKFSREIKATVTYHDPCHLGRHMGLYESPRQILEAIPGLKLVEMERNMENAWCCGAGGGVKSTWGGFALNVAKRRIEEAERTGANFIVTSCPFCKTNLNDAYEKFGGLRTVDVVELVLKAI